MRIRPMLLTLTFVLLIHGTAFADGGDVVGTVYLDDQPGSGLCVDVFDYAGNGVASQLTNGGGDYNIYVAEPGSYTVRFGDCGQGYTTAQWYYYAAKQDDAQAVQVVGDGITPNVNGYLYSAGRVTGHVVDTLNAVVTGACVKAEDQNGLPIGETTTDGNGNYALGGLPAGTTYIRFEGCSAGNYVRSAATPVMVEVGETKSGIDALLTPAGRISGHVQNADGEPLGGMCVGGWGGGAELPNVVTDQNGDYVIREVPPSGAYELSAYACYGGPYLNEQRSGQLGGVVNQVVNFTLPRPGHIVGHVRDESGAGLASICVIGTSKDGSDTALAQTDRNGYYELNQLRPGEWDLSFNIVESSGEESPCTVDGDWAPATTTGVVLGDGETLWDVDKTLAHPAPGGPGAGGGSGAGADPGTGAGPGTGPSGETSGPGGSSAGTSGDASSSGAGGGGPGSHPRGCRVPKLVGLSLAKARKALRRAGCGLGRVSRKLGRRHGRVLRQRTRRGTSKPAGFKVALTVAK